MRLFNKRSFLLILFFCLALLSLAYSQPLEPATVLKVIDGDTLLIQFHRREEKVRLIGIDSPERRINPKAEKEVQRTGHDIQTIIGMGKKASAFAESLVRRGDKIKIEFDIEKRDKY